MSDKQLKTAPTTNTDADMPTLEDDLTWKEGPGASSAFNPTLGTEDFTVGERKNLADVTMRSA